MTAIGWDILPADHGQAGYWRQRAEAAQEMAQEMALIQQRRQLADFERIRALEAAIQEMSGCLRGLASQGEDYIRCPAKRALEIAENAITPHRDSDASLAEDPTGLSREAVAARPEGICPTLPTEEILTMIQHTEKLAACPFCGGEAEIYPWPAGTVSVMCGNRDCEVTLEVEAKPRAEAIAAWNRRTSSTDTGEAK